MLADRVNAYRMIKADLREMQQKKSESLTKRLEFLNHRLNQEKAQIQIEIDASEEVKLHKRAYEIDFDAY